MAVGLCTDPLGRLSTPPRRLAAMREGVGEEGREGEKTEGKEEGEGKGEKGRDLTAPPPEKILLTP